MPTARRCEHVKFFEEIPPPTAHVREGGSEDGDDRKRRGAGEAGVQQQVARARAGDARTGQSGRLPGCARLGELTERLRTKRCASSQTAEGGKQSAAERAVAGAAEVSDGDGETRRQ